LDFTPKRAARIDSMTPSLETGIAQVHHAGDGPTRTWSKPDFAGVWHCTNLWPWLILTLNLKKLASGQLWSWR
jgi:hypothetical protein